MTDPHGGKPTVVEIQLGEVPCRSTEAVPPDESKAGCVECKDEHVQVSTIKARSSTTARCGHIMVGGLKHLVETLPHP